MASQFPDKLNEAQLALSAIGQYDVAASPLQMAMVSAAIANDGVLMDPVRRQQGAISGPEADRDPQAAGAVDGDDAGERQGVAADDGDRRAAKARATMRRFRALRSAARPARPSRIPSASRLRGSPRLRRWRSQGRRRRDRRGRRHPAKRHRRWTARRPHRPGRHGSGTMTSCSLRRLQELAVPAARDVQLPPHATKESEPASSLSECQSNTAL